MPWGGRSAPAAKARSTAALSSLGHPARRRGVVTGISWGRSVVRSSRSSRVATSACSAWRIIWPWVRTRLRIVVAQSTLSSLVCQPSRRAAGSKDSSWGNRQHHSCKPRVMIIPAWGGKTALPGSVWLWVWGSTQTCRFRCSRPKRLATVTVSCPSWWTRAGATCAQCWATSAASISSHCACSRRRRMVVPISCVVVSRASKAVSGCRAATAGVARSKQASSFMRSGVPSSTWQMSTRMWRMGRLLIDEGRMCPDATTVMSSPVSWSAARRPTCPGAYAR